MRNKSLLKKSILSIIFAALTAMFAVGLVLSSFDKQTSTKGEIEWTEDFSQTPQNTDTWLDNPDYYIASLSELEGRGTSSAPYKIYTAQQLAGLAYYTQNTGTLSNYFVLCDNIDLSAHYWVPIGCYYKYGTTTSQQRQFNGVFDGQGYTISGLYTECPEQSAAYSYMGLFGYLSGNQDIAIQNLNIVDSYVQGYQYVGGIAGYGSALIRNCSFDGVVSGSSRVGGIIGCGDYGKVSILNCVNYGKINATSYAGGIMGHSADNGEIKFCRNEGEVVSTGSNVGGIVGCLLADTLKIIKCSNLGNISSEANYAAGILGQVYQGNGADALIYDCLNKGSVVGVNYVAGISMCTYNRSSYDTVVAHCLNEGTISGQSYVYGTAHISYGQCNNTVNTGSVSGTEYLYGTTNRSVSDNKNYFGGNCSQNMTQISGSIYSSTLVQDMQDSNWWQDQTVWSEPWDFETTWQLVEGQLQLMPPLESWEDVAETTFQGSGTEEEPFQISSAEQLAGLSVLVNAGNTFQGQYFKVTQPLDMGGRNFTPIGFKQLLISESPSVRFAGNFDGGGFEIANLTMQGMQHGAYSNHGLFGYTNSGNSIIKNIILTDVDISAGSYVGGIVGRASATISNCQVSGKISGFSYLGGISGYFGTITDCINYADITSEADSSRIGGIVGEGSAENCENWGDISAPNCDYVGGISGSRSVSDSVNYGNVEGSKYVGGVSGAAAYSSSKYSFSNVHNYGRVSASNYVGGLVGARVSTIRNSSNHGQVSGGTSAYIGGIVGQNATSIYGCYNTGNITGGRYVGGILGGSGSIYNSYNLGTVKPSSPYSPSYTGGIGGYNITTISGCYNLGEIVGGTRNYVGGLAGSMSTSGAPSIINSYNRGSVQSTGNYIGGLVGDGGIASISNSYNLATVSGGANYVGGIAGRLTTGSITNCFNGALVSNSSGNMGAILGYGESSPISNCYFGIACTDIAVCGSGTATISATAFRATLERDAKSLSFYQDENLFDSSSPWDFNLIWQIDAQTNDGYPTFKEQSYWQDQTLDTEFAGKGTLENPYQISSEEELAGFASLVNGGNTFAGQYFAQTKDLDLSIHYWAAIGNSTYSFNGVFDGNNFEINGVNISETTSYQGLFGKAAGGELKNIHIKNSSIQGTGYVGGIVGDSDSLISNCSFDGAINTSSNYVGGIAGASDSLISNCSFNGTINSSSGNVGGIVGRGSDISSCSSYGSVNGRSTYVGGIVGMPTGAGNTISGCLNYATVTSTYQHIGGISGGYSLMYATFIDCINYGNVSGTYSSGIVGFAAKLIDGCINYGDISGSYCSGIGYQIDTITNCKNFGVIAEGTGNGAGISYMGGDEISNCENYGEANVGIVDNLYYASNSIIENCRNYAKVKSAGIVDSISSSSSNTRNSYQILNCANFGDVVQSSATSYAGGIVGYISNTGGKRIVIDSCFNAGNIEGGGYSGGIVGQMLGSGSNVVQISNCGSEGNVSGEGLVGAIAGNGRSDLSISNCYAVSSISQERLVGDDVTVPNNCVYILTVDDGSGVVTTYKKFIGNDFTGFAWLNDASCPIPKELAWSGQFQETPSEYQGQADWILYKMQQDGWTAVA